MARKSCKANDYNHCVADSHHSVGEACMALDLGYMNIMILQITSNPGRFISGYAEPDCSLDPG
ncbi:hypothetical protein CHS0354_016899 [Potamilus streckersoni]|uniref:Uncharacterized protein n=1 Tax=Potamilus streckersoni TaxID=2493646 RepID=A0AAE0VQU1_9BIVA|nr:hypothetical protein CHS0354_016899 [Potamilus streckersoni]